MQEIKPAAMKISEAAAYLGIGKDVLRQMADKGSVPCKRLNKERYFIVRDLDAWLKCREDWAENGNAAQTQGQVDCRLQASLVPGK
jgi:excisionase family DNA binding protein